MNIPDIDEENEEKDFEKSTREITYENLNYRKKREMFNFLNVFYKKIN